MSTLATLLGRLVSVTRFGLPALIVCALLFQPPRLLWASEDTAEVLRKSAPEDVEDLRVLQSRIKSIVKKAQPATVGVRIGPRNGSGVIVSKEGHVLTAGHVSGEPGAEVSILLHDGRRLKATSLGRNRNIDSGLVKITEEGTWPYLEMGRSKDLQRGQWCLALGHAGGFRTVRPAPVRLGRVLGVNASIIRTDCTLIGGDSGGPLLDLEGRIIGIHSRIGLSVTENVHVPIDTYHDTWDRLLSSESWGTGFGRPGEGRTGKAFLGVAGEVEAADCVISEVTPGSPAEKAGVKVGDVVIQFDSRKISVFQDLIEQVGRKKPGDEVALVVRRDGRDVTLKAVLGRDPG